MSADPIAPARRDEPVDGYVRYIRSFFARWATFYDLFAWSIFWVYRETVRRIEPRPGMSVLDVCTGTGEIARRCVAAGAAVTGIDLSPEMLAKARAKMTSRGDSVSLELMDARRLSFPDGSFDVVVISFGLHDMPPKVRGEVLREALRVARRRLVIADYDLVPRDGRRGVSVWKWSIGLFETPYFESFAPGGAEPLLEAAGVGRPRRTLLYPAFGIYEVDL